MKIADNKIVEATESELISHWLNLEYDDVMSFPEFKQVCIDLGVVIVPENDQKQPEE